ncbi:MAG: hypothetical protein N2510_07680 [Ignavibacteria bacterium]|nr:hypothetical protein [Ignavibacteria bacterium]
MSIKFKLSIFFVLPFVILSFITGCSDDGGVGGGGGQANPNVRSFDSLYIEEDSAAGSSFAGLNLLNGFNVTSTSPNRDVSLAGGTNPTGTNFFLRSGVLLDQLLDAGFETKFYRFYENLTPQQFDTISHLDAGSNGLDTTDFTQDDTYGGGVWSYFNAPLDTLRPVYGFYLKGRKAAGQNNNVRVYGILQPVTAGDRLPNQPYGFWMTFKVRINVAGQNDFRKMIPAN